MEGGARWAPKAAVATSELFELIVAHDRAMPTQMELETRLDLWASHRELVPPGNAYRAAQKKLDAAGRDVGRTLSRLEELLLAGLEAREGTRLTDELDVNMFLQVMARITQLAPIKAYRWHVCERCDVVFRAARAIRRNGYLCPGCKGQRIPPLQWASAWRQCVACHCLFASDDAQQRNCESCRHSKSSRSRHPERPPQPGTDRRRAIIDFSD
jgi:hypothetical protein